VDKFGTAKVTGVIDLSRPVVTPQMLKQVRKNIDLKVRPTPKAMKMPNKIPLPPKKSDEGEKTAPKSAE
jgi:hypothetical protein